ncbi:protein FRIGIDA [Syzygium oleosum]|uniref:protein FRIGIDA n=1 Tax=Syzygium oleosum TaxID=219896 RepID=UPI0011D212DC|nr:protein FRIGIDA [Syzygium oleosum]
MQPEQRDTAMQRSVAQLSSLSSAIDAFRRRILDLDDHLHALHLALDVRTLLLQSDSQPPRHRSISPPPLSQEGAKSAPELPESAPAPQSELEQLCHTMCSRGLRRYLVAHLSDVDALRRRVPPALKNCAPDVPKLVYECVGGFYLQGSKAFTHDSPMISARHAAILVLEFFLLSGSLGVREDPAALSVKLEAESSAIAWRKRLIVEGGVSRAGESDARGLLLFIASFGIPGVFKTEDIAHLLRLSNWKEIGNALPRSPFLRPRIPDVLEEMMKIGMSIEAVDVSIGFGLEDNFPPRTILRSFLSEAKERCDNSKKAHSSPMAVKAATQKQLTALKSSLKCLEDHNWDPAKVLPGWKLKETIVKLEKDVADIDKKMKEKVVSKRRIDVVEPSRTFKSHEAKRPKFSPEVAPRFSHPFLGFQEQKDNSRIFGRSLYDDGSRPIFLFDGGLSRHGSSYPAASLVSHGSGGGSLPETSLKSPMQSANALHSAGVGGRVSAGISMMAAGESSAFPGDRLADRIGLVGSSNNASIGQYVIRDAAYRDQLEQRNLGRYTSLGTGHYGPSLEGFKGLPKFSSSNATDHGSNFDLYGFADTIMERSRT